MAYLPIALGALLTLRSAWDQYRGVTHEPNFWRGLKTHARVTRAAQPERFRSAMKGHWYFACATLGFGVILQSVIRGLDRNDPMSPEFAGNKALDEWGEALRKEEERQRHHQIEKSE